MKKMEPGNKLNMDGVNLLISILVCYPEIGTLSFEPKDDSLKMTFVLGKSPAAAELDAVKSLIERSIVAYHALECLENASIVIKSCQYDGIVFLNIIRDMATLSKGEIALISTLIKERFGEILRSDSVVVPLEEEGIVQEDFIDNMIGSMKFNNAAEKLIGIREDGRVMVFNK